MDDIQQNIYQKANNFRKENTYSADSYEEFKKIIEEKGGFVEAHWDGTEETEMKIKEDTKATIRCIPVDGEKEEGKCIVTGKPSKQKVIFARAY
jgi:prolyl-tRNA synthetase